MRGQEIDSRVFEYQQGVVVNVSFARINVKRSIVNQLSPTCLELVAPDPATIVPGVVLRVYSMSGNRASWWSSTVTSSVHL